MNKSESKSNAKPILILILIFVISAAIIFLVNLITESRQESAENERIMQTVSQVLPAEKYESVKLMGLDNDGETQLFAGMLKNGDITGYAVICTVAGNGGDIKTAVGVSNGGVISKVVIMKSDDITPGFFQSAGSDDYLKQFEGISDANVVSPIPGAETSCSAIKDAVNRAIEIYGNYQTN